jgi:hypothetical protein
VIEGDDRTGTAITPTERVANTTQLFDKVVIVSEAQRKHNPAGRSDEMKYQLAMKAYPELKRDVEAMIVSNNVAVQGSGSVARKSAGLGTLIFTNISHGGAGATPAHTSGLATTAQTAGTNRAFAVTQLDTVMQSIFTNSGEMPNMISMTPNHKTAFSAFAGIALNRKEAGKKEQVVITGGADVYVSNFGALTVVPSYVQATANPNTVFILNPEQLALGVFNPMNSRPLAKTGHADKELASIECTLVVQSQTAQGAIKNLTP